MRQASRFGLLLMVLTLGAAAPLPASATTHSHAAASRANLAGGCEAAVRATSQYGQFVCLNSYTINGVTHQFGDSQFLADLPTSMAAVVVNGTGHDFGEAAPQPTSASQGTNVQPRRRLAHALTKTYQWSGTQDVVYGNNSFMGFQKVGEIRLNEHINLNGRQIQNSVNSTKVSGPAYDPAVSAVSDGCGENDFGPPNQWFNNWFPPGQNMDRSPLAC